MSSNTSQIEENQREFDSDSTMDDYAIVDRQSNAGSPMNNTVSTDVGKIITQIEHLTDGGFAQLANELRTQAEVKSQSRILVLEKQVEELQDKVTNGNNAPQNSGSTDLFAQLSAKVEGLILSQKVDQQKFEKLEKAHDDDQQKITNLENTITLLKNQLSAFTSARITLQQENAIELQRLEYAQFLEALPPPNQFQQLYLYIQHSPSVETRFDGTNFTCSLAWFFRNIDNTVHFLSDGLAQAKYTNGVSMEAIGSGYSLPETFVDDIIKTLPTAASPEKFARYFCFYADYDSKLPSWWSQHAHLTSGTHLQRVVTNQHNNSVKFNITIQSDNSKSKMSYFRIDRL